MKKISTALLALAITAGTTHAEGIAKRLERSHEARGITTKHGVVVKPKITVGIANHDNLYATGVNQKSDMAVSMKPEVEAEYRTAQYKLKANAGVGWEDYKNYTGQDTREPFVGVEGAYRLNPTTRFSAKAGFAVEHESRGNPDFVSSVVKPTQYTTAQARVGGYHRIGRVRAMGSLETKSLNFKNGYTSTGALVDSDARDRTENTQVAQLSYKINSRFSPFVRMALNQRTYSRQVPTNRDSNGQTFDAGLMFRKGTVMGEAYVGKMYRNYSGTYRDVTEPNFGGNVSWNVTPETTLTASLKRSFEETTRTGSSAFVQTAAVLGAQHALSNDWLLDGYVGTYANEYKGSAASQRDDDIEVVGAGTKYYLNRFVALGADYSYLQRQSNIAGADYGSSIIAAKATLAY